MQTLEYFRAASGAQRVHAIRLDVTDRAGIRCRRG